MASRIRELLLLIAVIAAVAYLRPSPRPPESEKTSEFPATAPPFELHSNLGPPRRFDGNGPLVVVLTAVGCNDCIARIPRDKEIYAMAQKANVPYYNILVYIQDDAYGATFLKQHHPAGDDVLNDPGGHVFVSQYRGSDNNCQMVIGRHGEFLYRGPENKEAMRRAINSL